MDNFSNKSVQKIPRGNLSNKIPDLFSYKSFLNNSDIWSINRLVTTNFNEYTKDTCGGRIGELVLKKQDLSMTIFMKTLDEEEDEDGDFDASLFINITNKSDENLSFIFNIENLADTTSCSFEDHSNFLNSYKGRVCKGEELLFYTNSFIFDYREGRYNLFRLSQRYIYHSGESTEDSEFQLAYPSGNPRLVILDNLRNRGITIESDNKNFASIKGIPTTGRTNSTYVLMAESLENSGLIKDPEESFFDPSKHHLDDDRNQLFRW